MDQQRLNYFNYISLAKKALEEMMTQHPELETLSSRELEIFEQLLTDKTQKKIAEELFITRSSVSYHCSNIYKKLQISNRQQLIITYKDLCQ